MSDQHSTATLNETATSSLATTSTHWPNDTGLRDWMAKHKVLVQQEFQRLRALPSLANCSGAHLGAMSRSYMIGSTDQEIDRELARNRRPRRWDS